MALLISPRDAVRAYLSRRAALACIPPGQRVDPTGARIELAKDRPALVSIAAIGGAQAGLPAGHVGLAEWHPGVEAERSVRAIRLRGARTGAITARIGRASRVGDQLALHSGHRRRRKPTRSDCSGTTPKARTRRRRCPPNRRHPPSPSHKAPPGNSHDSWSNCSCQRSTKARRPAANRARLQEPTRHASSEVASGPTRYDETEPASPRPHRMGPARR